MANTSRLAPEEQFPAEAIDLSVQPQPDPKNSPSFSGILTFQLGSVADQITAWGKNVRRRDQELREFWPSEPYLAGTVASISMRNSSLDWEIKSRSEAIVKAVTDMLRNAIAGDTVGWTPFVHKFSQDLYTTDNGAFIELIRDPGIDGNSQFKGSKAPVLGISHLDSNQCARTGNAQTPVIYTDTDGKQHKLQWYEVIPFSDFPSSIVTMNGVGYCAVTRSLRLAQIFRSIEIYKDEEVGGRNFKKLQIIGGVGWQQIEDALKRGKENADNRGAIRFVEHAILASLDPEKPVSVAEVELASLPGNFNFDQEMQWYIAGLSLDFGVDYQELAPLPGGNIGSSAQSMILHKKTSGKNPANFMRLITEAFTTYGVLPRVATMQFNDKNEQESLERQEVRTKAMEEAAIAVNSRILTPEAAAKSLLRRGIFTQEEIDSISPEFWANAAKMNASVGQNVGNRGGNTIVEDAGRTNSGKPNLTVGARLRKMFGVAED